MLVARLALRIIHHLPLISEMTMKTAPKQDEIIGRRRERDCRAGVDAESIRDHILS
jgi:hypothetical protein